MAVRMYQARMRTTRVVQSISDLSANDRGNIECNYCLGVLVTYVNDHYRRSRLVQAHLRLLKGFTHNNDCGYQPDIIIAELVRESRNVEDLDYGVSLFSEDGTTLRLNILTEAVSKNTHLEIPNQNNDLDENLDRIEIRKIKMKWAAPSFISSAAGIAKLIDELGGSTNLITLETRTDPIAWEDFYYPIEDYARLNRVTAPFNGNSYSNYAIALHGFIRGISNNNIQLEGADEKDANGNKIIYAPWIKGALQFHPDLRDGDEIIVVGIAQRSQKTQDNSITYVNITLWVNHSHQIVILGE